MDRTDARRREMERHLVLQRLVSVEMANCSPCLAAHDTQHVCEPHWRRYAASYEAINKLVDEVLAEPEAAAERSL